MDKTVSTIIIGLILVAVLVGMWLSWRGRQRRQAGYGHPIAPPPDPGAELLAVEGLYLATTAADDPLDRIAVKGLGFRARARVVVAESGVILELRGEGDAFIPRSSLRGAGEATWTIDRTVEPGGLVMIGWRLGEGEGRRVDSYLRVATAADQPRLISAVRSLLSEDADA